MLCKKEVACKFLPEIKYLRDWETVSIRSLISRIKYAKQLFRIYENGPFQSSIVTFQLQGSVTWLKLLRGRWLLVASSDLDQSKLSLWDVSEERKRLVTQLYLTGPVMDGKCDDSVRTIFFALSIGTKCVHTPTVSTSTHQFFFRRPYISVFRLFAEVEQAHILQVAEIKNASHVLLLKGSLLGYAVQHGDDTMPCLENWETRESYLFAFPPNIADSSIAMKAHNAGIEHVSCLMFIVSQHYDPQKRTEPV